MYIGDFKNSPEYRDYVEFGDVARGQLGQQCQYASRYLDGKCGGPNLGEGIRFVWLSPGDYHSIIIHKDDVEKFVQRVIQYRKDLGLI